MKTVTGEVYHEFSRVKLYWKWLVSVELHFRKTSEFSRNGLVLFIYLFIYLFNFCDDFPVFRFLKNPIVPTCQQPPPVTYFIKLRTPNIQVSIKRPL